MAEFLKEHKLIRKTLVELKEEQQTELRSDVTSEEALKGRVTALYFSASWCPPCQVFTSLLGEFYEQLKEKENKFEVVFVSLDHSKEDMEDYYIGKHGQWLALPFDDPLKESLINKYRITVIPKLVVIKDNGDVVTFRGRKDVQDKGTNCFRNWLNNSNIPPPTPMAPVVAEDTNNSNVSGEVTPTGMTELSDAEIVDEISGDVEEEDIIGELNKDEKENIIDKLNKDKEKNIIGELNKGEKANIIDELNKDEEKNVIGELNKDDGTDSIT